MKGLAILLLIALSFNAFAQQPKKNAQFRIVRTLVADLNNDNKPDTIKLISNLPDWNSFNKISISISGSTKKTFKAKDYWTVVDSNFLIRNKNAIHTKLLYLKKSNKHAVILLFGELDGAGYRGEFSIINIENNNIKMVFDDNNNVDVEIPWKLIDLENNGRLDFVYTNFHEFEGFSGQSQKDKGMPDIGPYDPYLIYMVDDTCKLNKALTKSYNEKNYVFAGFGYSEKIHVLYPGDKSKPKLWKKGFLQ